jgi:ADP-heptose:LPS heptosyltransferase
VRRLLIRPGAIGDFLVSLPALEHLRTGYTEIWCTRPNVALARFADHARAIADTGIDLVGIGGPPPGRTLEDLRSFDEIVSWYGAARPEFRDAVAGLPFRFLTALPDRPAMHATDFYLRQVGGPPGAVPRIDAPPSEPRPGIVIHPFSGGRSKNWPLDRYRALAAHLAGRAEVSWTAGPEEVLEEARRFDDLFELARWLAGTRVFVGNDSGIAHLAAAAGAPVVALFGPSDPAVWAPRGRVRVVRCGDRMEDIDVSVVERAVESMLRNP